jgi:hypothetical protein
VSHPKGHARSFAQLPAQPGLNRTGATSGLRFA